MEYVILIGCRNIEEETRTIRKYGYKIILFNSFISINSLCFVDLAFELDFNNTEGVLEKVNLLIENKLNIVSVLTQNEYRTELTANIASICSTCFLSEHTAALCRNKLSVRNALRGTPLDTVSYVVNENIKTLLKDTENLNFPVVAKPENDAGSHHVYVCRDMEALWDAVTVINGLTSNFVNQSMNQRTLIEQYIGGREFSVESISDSSSTKVIAITEKFTHGSIEKAHLVPGRLSPSEKKNIEAFVVQLHGSLAIQHAVTHTEIKLEKDNIKLIEINGRTGGDNIVELVRLTTNLDLFEAALLLSLGKSVDEVTALLEFDPDKTTSAMSIFLFANKNGCVRFRPCRYPLNKSVPDGTRVRETTSNYNRLGSYIVSSKNLMDPLKRISESDEYISIE